MQAIGAKEKLGESLSAVWTPPIKIGVACFCLLLLPLWSGCSSINLIVDDNRNYALVGEEINLTFAGAAKVSLAPPRGLAMGGYGPDGPVSSGHWLGLYARTFVLGSNDAPAAVLVVLDSWSVPQGLVAEVLASLRKSLDFAALRPSQLIIAATHTHHSPGNIATSKAYNYLAQSAHGFNEDLFNQYVVKIASSVQQAWNSRTQAKLLLKEGSSNGLFRNRSLPAFRLNPGMGTVTDPAQDPAVDPRIRSLWILAADETPVGVLALVPVHPTVLPKNAPIFSPDIFGVAARDLEQTLAESSDGVVVGIVNGPEGDQSAQWNPQSLTEVVRLGSELSKRILRSEQIDELEETEFRSVHIVRRISRAPLEDGRTTAPFAMPGAAMVGGAEDGRTDLHGRVNFYEGARRKFFRIPWHGAKPPAIPLIWPLLNIFIPPPAEVSLTLWKISDKWMLATIPGEATTYLGRQLENRLYEEFGPRHAWVIGLANGYVSYFSTEHEYDAQHYEGASTLFGPLSARFVEDSLLSMDFDMSDEPFTRTYSVGRRIDRDIHESMFDSEICCGKDRSSCSIPALLGLSDDTRWECYEGRVPQNQRAEDIQFFDRRSQTWITMQIILD